MNAHSHGAVPVVSSRLGAKKTGKFRLPVDVRNEGLVVDTGRSGLVAGKIIPSGVDTFHPLSVACAFVIGVFSRINGASANLSTHA